jgi:GntR family transcriptional regulator, transcriptional repressor for pyruvate dehydrogenase complex
MTIQSRWRAKRGTRAHSGNDDQAGDVPLPSQHSDTGVLHLPVGAHQLRSPDAITDNSRSAHHKQGSTRAVVPNDAFTTDTAVVNACTPVRTPKAAVVIAQTLRRLIVDGHLKEGDFLPNETRLMDQYAVSRSTLREAVRLLESERLLEVRRGARTGARIRIPGPETVARPAGLLLQVSGATVADVMAARAGIEPVAVFLLAQNRTPRDLDELESILAENIPAARESGRLPTTIALFHLRLVKLSGNVTLSMIAAMLYEITERHSASPSTQRHKIAQSDYETLLSTYRVLIDLLRARDSGAAEAHWRRHMNAAIELMSNSQATRKVRDVID